MNTVVRVLPPGKLANARSYSFWDCDFESGYMVRHLAGLLCPQGGSKCNCRSISTRCFVGAAGFEPTTCSTQSAPINGLRNPATPTTAIDPTPRKASGPQAIDWGAIPPLSKRNGPPADTAVSVSLG